MRKPFYDLADLVAACAKESPLDFVAVWRGALKDAREQFPGLDRQIDVCHFIGGGGLEQPQHINTKELEHDLGSGKGVVDAYSFFAGDIFGYIAFMQSLQTGKWLIKSFKANRDENPRKKMPTAKWQQDLFEFGKGEK